MKPPSGTQSDHADSSPKRSPLVLHIPHSSTIIPDPLRSQLFLQGPALDQELLRMTDWFTEELFDLPEATRIVFPVSRLVVDPERFLDDAREVMASVGMGVIYSRTSQGVPLRPEPSDLERSELLNRYYHPHHHELSEAVDHAVNALGYCLVVDGHSFPSTALPYEPDQGLDRPDICLGTDSFHTPDWLIELAVAAFQDLGLTVAIDRPFAGALVPMKHFHQDARVLSLMVELNRRLYLHETTGARTDSFDLLQAKVWDALTAITEACRSHH